MKEIYNKLTTKSFKLISTLLLLFADTGILTYLYLKFSDKDVFQRTMKIVMSSYPHAQRQIGPHFEKELYTLMVNSLLTMILIALFYHLIVYLFWNRGKKLPHSYISLYVLIATPGSLLAGLSDLIHFNILSGIFWIILALFYGFVLMGLKRFKKEIKEIEE